VNISVEVQGEERMERDIRGFNRNLDMPVRPVARELGEVTASAVRAQYASSGRRGPKGRPWSRKQETVERYTAMNRRGFRVLNEPMRRTDALYQSEATLGGPHSVFEVDDNALTMGTTLKYGLIQQRRGQTQYDPTDEDLRRYGSIIRRGLVKGVNEFFDYKPDFAEAAF
jgi:hypothetical protein